MYYMILGAWQTLAGENIFAALISLAVAQHHGCAAHVCGHKSLVWLTAGWADGRRADRVAAAGAILRRGRSHVCPRPLVCDVGGVWRNFND